MPHRDRATVEVWVAEWRTRHELDRAEITVLEDYVPGENSAVVVATLRSASTITYLRPIPNDGRPQWVATFEPRDELTVLDYVGLRTLAEDMALLGDLLTELQAKTDAALAK